MDEYFCENLTVLNTAYDTSNIYYNNALFEKREINKNIFRHNFDGSPLEQNVFDYVQTNFKINLEDIKNLSEIRKLSTPERNKYNKSWESFLKFYPKHIIQTNNKIDIRNISSITNDNFRNPMKKLHELFIDYTINEIRTEPKYLDTNISLSHTTDLRHMLKIVSKDINELGNLGKYYHELSPKINTFIGCNKINGDVGRLLFNTLILGKVIDTNFSFEPKIAYFSGLSDYYDLKALPQNPDKSDNYFITRYSKALGKFRELVYGKSK